MTDSLEILEATRGVCRRVRHVLVRYEEGREPEQLDCLIFHVERLHRLLLSLHVTTDDIIEAVAVSLSLLEELNSSTSGACSHGYAVPVLHENSRGRPRFDIKPEQLEYLLTLGLKCPKIAEVLGVSLSTIRRRMTEYGFSVTSLYANITDQELDRIVSEIKQQFPNSGYRLMHGHLLSRGLRIHQARVRASLHRVDPDGVVIRWASAVVRRKYSVFSPLSLWHLDGHHKLIRWRLVVHGAVDGYSRIPVYLHCSDNNRADTVLRLFREAVSLYGLPSRIRIDKGGENVDVSMYLLDHPLRGPGRSTVIVGKSVHNQRIERMWRDVYEGVVGFYHSLFNYIESLNMLDPNNALHLFCLHMVYIPRINKHLRLWQEAWMKHPLRTEHNLSPEQLWTTGLQRIARSENHIAKEVFEDLDEEEGQNFGVDWSGPVPHDSCEGIHVPETPNPLNRADLAELQATVSHLEPSMHYGLDIYEHVLQFLSSKLGCAL